MKSLKFIIPLVVFVVLAIFLGRGLDLHELHRLLRLHAVHGWHVSGRS